MKAWGNASDTLTSNRVPAKWSAWFADPLLASLGLDRLSHRAHVSS